MASAAASTESPLAAAVNVGAADIAAYLLDNGASPKRSRAFDGGSTPLHIAVRRGDHEMVRTLLAAGADPAREDRNGRTPAKWSAMKAATARQQGGHDMLWARIRAVDLFCPLRARSCTSRLPTGSGAMRTIYGIVDSYDATFWMLVGTAPTSTGVRTRSPRERYPRQDRSHPTGPATDRRSLFAESLDRLAADTSAKVVLLAQRPVTSTTSPSHSLAWPPIPTCCSRSSSPPRARACSSSGGHPGGLRRSHHVRRPAGSHPKLAHDRSCENGHPDMPDGRHERIAAAARDAISVYTRLDPAFDLPDPSTFVDPTIARRAQALIRSSHT